MARMSTQRRTIPAGTRVEHIAYPGEMGTVLGPADCAVGGNPTVTVRWDDTEGDTATWTQKLRPTAFCEDCKHEFSTGEDHVCRCPECGEPVPCQMRGGSHG